jgi:hypothetical protein
MNEALSEVTSRQRVSAANVIMTELASIGEKSGAEARPKADVDVWASAIGDVLGAYLDRFAAMPYKPR